MEEDEKVENSTRETSLKRKHNQIDEADPKLKEFLEVMQPPSKTKRWISDEVSRQSEPPTKMQAIELPDGDSDGEYQAVPKSAQAKPTLRKLAAIDGNDTVVVPDSSVLPEQEPVPFIEATLPEPAPDATDDDWLRSRTNRLLDLEPMTTAVMPITKEATHADDRVDRHQSASFEDLGQETANADAAGSETHDNEDTLDQTMETIRASGRIFVRNLPYSATEDDLRKHFETFGTLEEVR